MTRRWLLVALVTVIVLFIAAAGVLYWLLSGDGIRRALETQASDWLGEPVQIGSARAQLFPRIGISLSDVRAGDPARLTLEDVDVTASLLPLLSRRIEEAEIVISGSRIELPLPFTLPSAGEPAGGSDAQTDEGGGIELVSVRAITLRDITLTSRGREVTVSADSSLEGQRLDLEQFTASSGRTQLAAAGVVQLEPRVDAMLTVEAEQVDIDELLSLAAAFAPPSGDGARSATRTTASGAAPSDARITATITADTARTGELEIENFATELHAEGNRVTLSPLTFELFGGTYAGTLNASLGDAIAATLESRITGLDVAQLAAFGGAPDTMTGTLSGAGTFTGQGADLSAALATARGSGKAAIDEGTIRHLDLVRTIVLFFGRPDPGAADAGTNRFDEIALEYSLANQVFRADTIAFDSPDVDIVGTGTLGVQTKALDGDLTLSLSEELSRQAGTDLARFTREGDRILLPANLGGTLDQPRITIDAKEAITRGIRNEAERRLKGVLEGLLK
jgi:uncharacterized protein involved in outer membrane biogenesis